MYFIANWKMFGGLSTLNSLKKVIKFLKIFKKSNKAKIIYCPPSTLISPMSKKVMNSKIQVGAQNCHESQNYTIGNPTVTRVVFFLNHINQRFVSLPPLVMINQNHPTNELIMCFGKNIMSVRWDFWLIQVFKP